MARFKTILCVDRNSFSVRGFPPNKRVEGGVGVSVPVDAFLVEVAFLCNASVDLTNEKAPGRS